MAGERQEPTDAPPDPADARQETITADALVPGTDGAGGVVEMHRRIAVRLLSEGSASRAFGELVRASRAVPMSRRLASALVRFSLEAGTEAAAITLLDGGLNETEGDELASVRRQLIRLLRRAGDSERAREHLVVLLAERAQDRRARAVLNALLEKEGRWEELDASLEKALKEALRVHALRRAARITLRRATLCAERLGDQARAALRYAQAAQLAEDAGDPSLAVALRLLWLRALKTSQAPGRALQEATEVYLRLATAIGQKQRAEEVIRDLGLGEAPPTSVPRRITQLELVAQAEAAQARGRAPEAAVLMSAALAEGADLAAAKRLEAQYIARGAWRELVQLYRDSAKRAPAEAKAEYLQKLAELLEDELHDARGAAGAYAELFQLTGDKAALAEQVRLLSTGKDVSGVRRALDAAVSAALAPRAKAEALVARAEAALARREADAARADFEEAVRAAPDHLQALAGFAELSPAPAQPAAIQRFRDALAAVPKRQGGRAELHRRLARLLESAARDAPGARAAWSEVLGELPEDEEAQSRLVALARETGDGALLEKLLRAYIQREPRGPKTRESRIELVKVLEQAGRHDDALAELRTAVKFEPGHKDAWLALANRLIERGVNGEAAWSLEQAASTTEDGVEREQTWARLAEFCGKVLKDEAKARLYAGRAEKLRKERTGGEGSNPFTPIPMGSQPRVPARPSQPNALSKPVAVPVAEITPVDARASAGLKPIAPELPRGIAKPPAKPPLPPQPPVVTPPKALGSARQAPPDEREPTQRAAGLAEAEPTPSPAPRRGAKKKTGEVPLAASADVLEVTTGDVEPLRTPEEFPAWDAPPGRVDTRPKAAEPPAPLLRTSATEPAHKLARTQLFARVRADPLDAEGYRVLAGHFEETGEPERSALMAEIADALDGDPEAAPRPPKLILSATDRAGLRHPALRNEAGELLGLAGTAFARLFPARGRAAGSREEFRLDAGRGAQAAADALLAAVRILGLRAPEVVISEENGPPFSLVYANGPRMLVGRLAVKKTVPDGELRFFAGRALFNQSPDLLALRALKKDQLSRALNVLASVLRGGRALSAEGRAMRDALPAKSLPRLTQLLQGIGRDLHWSQLAEGSRHSINRAGLVVCGGVAPAVEALRAKKALESEIVELIRFAASERYLQLRNRRLKSS